MSTRILVTGKYVDKSTYVLYKEDGTVYKEIREGEAFTIDNQLRPWMPVRVPKRSGHGTILMCQKYGTGGYVKEEFPLVNNKRGLWALTSGAARNGVFHNYHEPQNELEKQLSVMGVSRNIVENVETIDEVFEVGGQLCHHCVKNWGYGLITDGTLEDLTEPEYAPMDHFNQYHRGCMVSTYETHVSGGTYVLYYSIGTYMNGCRHKNLQRVIMTADASMDEVVGELKNI